MRDLARDVAELVPLSLDTDFATIVAGGPAGISADAVFGPFISQQYSFNSVEVYVGSMTLWRVLGADDLPVVLNNTRVRIQIIFALRGDGSVSWWRLHYYGLPFIESKVDDNDGGSFRVADIELDTPDRGMPVVRIDFLTHGMTISGQEVAEAWSMSFDLRHSMPRVLAVFAYPAFVKIPVWYGEDVTDCYFLVNDRATVCTDAQLDSTPWVLRMCQAAAGDRSR